MSTTSYTGAALETPKGKVLTTARLPEEENTSSRETGKMLSNRSGIPELSDEEPEEEEEYLHRKVHSGVIAARNKRRSNLNAGQEADEESFKVFPGHILDQSGDKLLPKRNSASFAEGVAPVESYKEPKRRSGGLLRKGTK
eukprot:CAMPEP_0114985346 /NCGR_PEP_ID=MMETSP0216-20121206/7805_1 /TAXON_ID=223996 /ORGANISM="Protocruzia adherens, Strain Boccale" /LENGTH=140 /DNA_ID=CAMNT_0002347631 /DNA_START=446 /DNA_END=865 /DNA_ORIENTATION=-